MIRRDLDMVRSDYETTIAKFDILGQEFQTMADDVREIKKLQAV